MTDKELLEKAAKAAEIEIVGLVDKMICQPDHKTGGFIIRNDRGGDSCWNPLTDDGDALRLAVKLGLSVTIGYDVNGTEVVCAMKFKDRKKSESSIITFFKQKDDACIEIIKDNPYANTRRAIVRMAAEIGAE